MSTHISALSSRQHRDASSTETSSSRSSSIISRASRSSSNARDLARPSVERTPSEQQLLTSAEIAERKKARRALELKRIALEEAVERRACEKIYERIWRHRSTDDEERDEKLRSKTAALAVVGVGLEELGIELNADSEETKAQREQQVKAWLSGAREGLMRMNDDKYPLGKLLQLELAHKGIVDALSRFRSSSSSADEILPALIYTLITTPSEGINVVSNLYFIQRFRCLGKLDGEAEYCLTNLEAAVTFLETVDLASLKADEVPEGPPKSASRPTTPSPESSLPLSHTSISSIGPASPAVTSVSATSTSLGTPSPSKPFTPTHQRRLSYLLQPPANALGAAIDAGKATADHGIKSVGDTLENSYKFLFGRLKERQVSSSGIEGSGDLVVPKTLDEARRLVGAPHLKDDDSISVASSNTQDQTDVQSESTTEKADEKFLSATPERSSRDRSVDSTTSGGSGKRVAFAEGLDSTNGNLIPSERPTASVTSAPRASSSSNPAVESMRTLGNTLNPLNHLAGMSVMRGFGRREMPAGPAKKAGSVGKAASENDLGGVADLATAFPDLADSLPPKEYPKVDPPIRRFMEIKNPGDLKISEVLQLLRDYRRLATALKERDAF